MWVLWHQDWRWVECVWSMVERLDRILCFLKVYMCTSNIASWGKIAYRNAQTFRASLIVHWEPVNVEGFISSHWWHHLRRRSCASRWQYSDYISTGWVDKTLWNWRQVSVTITLLPRNNPEKRSSIAMQWCLPELKTSIESSEPSRKLSKTVIEGFTHALTKTQ
jgi:hypothetical protein